MQELYFPEAVVLDREEANDYDSRLAIYAKGHGKFFAKAKSARKILSKLSGHLEPGSLIRVRLVGNGGLQVADALKYGKSLVAPSDLYLLNRVLPEADFDLQIWAVLAGSLSAIQPPRPRHFSWSKNFTEGSPSSKILSGREPFDWRTILRVLGWDPQEATCYKCEKRPVFFDMKDQIFLCDRCLSGSLGGVELGSFKRRSELIRLDS